MSQNEDPSPEIDRARDLEIHAQTRKEARVLRADIGRFENTLEEQQDRDTTAGRSQSSLPGTSVGKVSKLNARRIHFEAQADLIHRKEDNLFKKVFGSHTAAAQSNKEPSIPRTSALKNTTILSSSVNLPPHEYETPINSEFQVYDVPNSQPTAGSTPSRATTSEQVNRRRTDSLILTSDEELGDGAEILSSTKHPEASTNYDRSRVRFNRTVDKHTYSNPSPSREETNTTTATSHIGDSRENRERGNVDEVIRSARELLESLGYPHSGNTEPIVMEDEQQNAQQAQDDQQRNENAPMDPNTVNALIAALRPVMQREIEGIVNRVMEMRDRFYDEPMEYENQRANQNRNEERQNVARIPDDDGMVREVLVGNDLERSLGDLPSLTDQNIEKLKSFIRMSTIIWSDLGNLDGKRKFMRRIKLKVTPCSWISEEELDNANTWPQIRSLLENGLKRELNPQKLRTRVNALSQNVGEKLSDYAKRAEDLMRDYEVLHGNQMNDTLRSTIELQIKEQFENGIFDRKTREAMTMAATEKLQASINLALRIQTRREESVQANEIICAYCSRRGHRQVECRTRQEHLCQSNSTASTSGEPLCTRCHFRGHTSRDCRMIAIQRGDNLNRNQSNHNNFNGRNNNNPDRYGNSNSGGGRYNNNRNNNNFSSGNGYSNNNSGNGYNNNSGNNFSNNRNNNNYNNGYNNSNSGYNNGNNNNYGRGNSNNNGYNGGNNQNQNYNGGQRYYSNNGFNNNNSGNNNHNSGNSNNNVGNQRNVRNVETNQRRGNNLEN